MKRILSVACCWALFITVYAQDPTVKKLQEESSKPIKKDPHDTTGKIWKTGGLFSLNIAQGSLSNWQGGGDKFSSSAVGILNLFAFYLKEKDSWDNTLDIGYGYLRTSSLGARKSDDRLNLTSKYGHQIGRQWKVSGLFDFRTQFSKGYTHSEDASGRDISQFTSDILSPAYILLSVGFDYKPNSYFSLFVSPLTERYIIVSDDYLSSIGAYGVDSGYHKKNELGAFLSATFNKEIFKNITYKSKLDLFSNYKAQPKNLDLFWNNILSMKVNEYISANILVDLLYDDDAIARLQLRELLGVGIGVKF